MFNSTIANIHKSGLGDASGAVAGFFVRALIGKCWWFAGEVAGGRRRKGGESKI